MQCLTCKSDSPTPKIRSLHLQLAIIRRITEKKLCLLINQSRKIKQQSVKCWTVKRKTKIAPFEFAYLTCHFR